MMYNREFFQTKLGKASLISIGAMVLFLVISTQMHTPSQAAPATSATVLPVVIVEIA